MDIIISVLRLGHIVLGAVWLGFGALSAWVLHPAADQLGEKGAAMLRTFYGYSRFNMILPIAAIGTTVAGLILWPLRTTNGMDLLAFGATGDIVMAVGALAGLLAFGHGWGATGRFSGMFSKAAKAYDENPNDENKQTLDTAKTKLYTHGNISAWLTLVSLIFMAGARYLG